MGFSKATQPSPAYRDDPDYAETASMSSAVLLDDVESASLDEELPAYSDEPTAPLVDLSCNSDSAAPTPASQRTILHGYYRYAASARTLANADILQSAMRAPILYSRF